MDQLYFIVTIDDIPLLDVFILTYYKGHENSATKSLSDVPFTNPFDAIQQIEIAFKPTSWHYSVFNSYSGAGYTLGDLDMLRYPDRYPELLI